MPVKLKLKLRQASPWLIQVLRLVDVSVVVALVPFLVWAYDALRGDHYQVLMIIAGLGSIFIFNLSGLYQPRRGQDYFSEFLVILRAWLLVVGLVLLTLFVLKTAQKYSRAVLLMWFLLTPLIIFGIHVLFRKLLHILRARGKNVRSAVIIGAGDLGLALSAHLDKTPWTGIQLRGFFDDRKTTKELPPGSPPVLGMVDDLRSYLELAGADFVYIALPFRAEKKIKSILAECRTMQSQIYLVPDLYAFRLYNAQVETLGDMLLLNFNPASNRKRLFDVLFSLTVLALSAPICALIAVLIKLQDCGPVLYRHQRISVTGKPFDCLKFRTMYPDADQRLQAILDNDPAARQEWETTFKLKKDPRVTPLGRILRRTSLDELPQFWNVLKGEMSVVGARPIVEAELCGLYQENGGLYCSMKPGVTGPWQVSRRSDTQNYAERIALDSWYALNHSLWLDLRIIARTIVAVITGKGAY